MATGSGLNIGRYGATPGRLEAALSLPTARRSSRRRATGSVSGHHTSRCRWPARSRQQRKASGPRHCSCTSWIGWPSRMAASSLPGKTKVCGSKRACFHPCHPPQAKAANANGQADQRGISETSTENAASRPRQSKAPISQREGRHSSRQLTDPLDEWCECVIRTVLIAHEPAPELIVLAIQQL